MTDIPVSFQSLSETVLAEKRSAEPRNAPRPSGQRTFSRRAQQPGSLSREAAPEIAISSHSLERNDKAETTRATEAHSNRTTRTSELDYVVDAERRAIALRRRELAKKMPLTNERLPRTALTSDPDKIAGDVVGLALSGGGIRSAAFSLGAMQALSVERVLERIDYLSTVSGGGFSGAAVSSTMATDKGSFIFAQPNGSTNHASSDIADTDAVGHIRNYSNYLVPDGFVDFVSAATIVLRGLTANTVIILPLILLLAAFTILSNPTVKALDTPSLFGLPIERAAPTYAFGLGALAVLFLFVAFGLWALQRSLPKNTDQAETAKWPSWALGLALATCFCELQPYALKWLFDTASGSHHDVAWLEALLAPLLVIVTSLKDKIIPFLERSKVADGWLQLTKAAGARLLIWGAALALPLLIWIAYISFCYWGIVAGADDTHRPIWIDALTRFTGARSGYDAAGLYMVLALPLAVAAWFLRPNANSLHQLYRDRLGKAFLFKPSAGENGSFLPAGDLKLSKLDPTFAPYHLINTAVNLEGSRYLNMRGRNADFFLFSPLFVGSAATGYMPRLAFEQACPTLDLASAIAISGAAISSNMGAQSIRALTPTLALLNARLGYWIDNPRFLRTTEHPDKSLKTISPLPKHLATNSTRPGKGGGVYLFDEMFGRLSEETARIYLTDGGHIDNLGVYELLRRRCQLIIVVDAEADPLLTFGALVSVERYARIDLGIRITLPWVSIQKMSLAHSGANWGTSDSVNGPHVALGVIDYGEGEGEGLLLYIKSSLSGDENDYVLDYARRNASFPHETTGDQFFGEEQFEAYRALGFHITQRVLSGDDPVSFGDPATTEVIPRSDDPRLVRLRSLLRF